MNAYGENFCRAVDTIIAERLQELSFDKTITCKVVSVTDQEQGKYLVSNGSSEFYAYVNDNSTYKEKNSVHVLIPEGDFNNKKLIVGSATEEENVSWQSAVKQFLPVFENTYSSSSEDRWSIVVNNNIQETLLQSEDVFIPAETTALCISADFKTDFFDFEDRSKKMIKGNYGLKVCLSTEVKDYWLELVNSDMIGDVYNFGLYLTQSKIFDIIQIDKNILKISLYLYQSNDFEYRILEGESDQGNTEKFISEHKNVFINNIRVQAGYPNQTYSSSGLEIYCLSDASYSEDQTEEELKRTLKAKWTQNFDGKAINIESSDKMGLNELKWYFQLNSSEEWNLISDQLLNNFSITIDLNTENQLQKYKAVIVNKDGEQIESNVFSFKKINTVKNGLKISLLQKVTEAGEINYKNVNGFVNNYNLSDGETIDQEFKVLIEYRGYDGSKKNIEDNYQLTVEQICGDNLISKNSFYINSEMNIQDDGSLLSTAFALSDNSFFLKPQIYKIILKTSSASYEKIFYFGYKALNYSSNGVNYSGGINLTSNLDLSNNIIEYNNIGNLNNYFSQQLFLYNLNNLIQNIDIKSYNGEETNFVNDILITNDKLNPTRAYVWGGNDFGQIQFFLDEQLLYAVPILIEQDDFSTQEEEVQWKVKHISDTYRMNTFSSTLGFGRKNNDRTFSGIYFGKYNQDQGLFSIENGKLNLYIGPSGTTFGGWKISGDEYSTKYSIEYPARYTGAFFGLRKSVPEKAFYFSEKGLEAWGVAGRQYYTAYFNSVFGVYQKTQYDSTTETYGPGGSYYVDIINLTFSKASDRRIKTNFQLFNDRFEKFYDTLQPCCYNLKTSLNKISNGFVAQDVLKSLKDIGIDKDNQTLVREDGQGLLSLSYTEFIPLNTWQIQRLKNRVNNLEQEVQELKQFIKEKMEL